MVLPNTGWCCACFEEVALKRKEDLARLRSALKRDVYRLGHAWKVAIALSITAEGMAALCTLLGHDLAGVGFNLLAAVSLVVWWHVTGRERENEKEVPL